MLLKRWLGFPHLCANPKSIFIGLIGGVGDLVLATPSVAALKKRYPSAKINFGVEETALTVEVAQERVDMKMKALQDSLDKLGVKKEEI
ncbi:MAG: hypothetical protein HOD90_05650, partial [Nitrospina sp.]|nr:hypothetical protein [Nitrospina sp.]